MNQNYNLLISNLDIHHKNYKTGVFVNLAGAIVSSAGLLLQSPELTIAGGIASLIGFGITLDSDKWFASKFNRMSSYKKTKQSKISFSHSSFSLNVNNTKFYIGDKITLYTKTGMIYKGTISLIQPTKLSLKIVTKNKGTLSFVDRVFIYTEIHNVLKDK